MSFKDFFSTQAKEYAKYRPGYPASLFEYLSGLAPSRERAWDCATGNGQAAIALTRWFGHVDATDASAEQIRNAEKHSKVSYSVAPAEASGFADKRFDLVTSATAAHWFDLPKFFAEVKRVLKPGGTIAIWTYGGTEPDTDSKLAEIYRRYSKEIVGPHSAPELKRVWDGYKTIDFPFPEVQAPQFTMRIEWNLEQTLGYLLTWSATQKYIENTGKDPRDEIRSDLAAVWGDPERKIAREWKLDLRVGRNDAHS
jgi:SAM-dependent methyltransferase